MLEVSFTEEEDGVWGIGLDVAFVLEQPPVLPTSQ